MPLSRVEIATPSAERLMNRLCKHWAHKLEVEQSDQQATITFATGTCLMVAEADKLVVALETLEEEHLDELEGVVERHLIRMAGDEELAIVWEN
ncbi:DUF2218 domain-containing protein [Halomonas sp. ISL-60]|uniref:DUF2218 domain-containing protein n=1 Tax=unclassified Halomonas TaxID=2609666 RepID=UPI0007D97887|nr:MULTISPECIES: DUF2218 domain-containing protein [unclassified Halomonas]MBT2771873.1 DUF2218 domain-containing protein [Halomonas sp. ISL-60]MBT2785682.1 DUF2218 domain-containing protein [Halomonas sp. ISL-106]MBT2798736.1 DUF2218 domain-containing protein [Halomonas sp. ISL-104]MBT2800162.1 DUF2218 domain-containing protein [Halomonas sp. ISL-56]OAL59106.1 hypothetical protein A6R74_04740 [Halomonas sp. ALS9]